MTMKRFALIGMLIATALSLAWQATSLAQAGRTLVGYDVLYPTPETKLVFSHARHKDTACLDCHAGIMTSDTAKDRNLPGEDVCGRCHKEQIRQSVNEVGSVERCALCHSDYDSTNASRPARSLYPPAKLIFAHKAHAAMDCAKCHADIAAATVAGGRHMPKEAVCLECHKRREAGKGCAVCHPELPSGMVQTNFDGVKLLPGLGPLDHQRDWPKRHKSEAALDETSCKDCHQQRDCNTCHDGVKKPMAIHPEDYVTTHPIDARKNRLNCRSCHRYQTFCVGCHQKLGLTEGATRKSERRRIHPEGFASCTVTPDHHAFQARRSLTACVACHREDDCLQCHKSGSVCGGRINIHGHLSNGQLTRMQKRNPRACRKCHEGK
ncbi:MAG: hypothetical protein C4523_17400 [Myxococcales bacterium]|nr:MAG: hypothetical protein C4523_17400 [Myxococcales bacterium]